MTISSVSSSVPPTPIVSTDASQQQPPVKTDGDDSSSQQVRAPLPPGQGTRVDQLA